MDMFWFLEKGEKRERNIDGPPPVLALTGDRSHNPSVHRTTFHQTEPLGQGQAMFLPPKYSTNSTCQVKLPNPL